MTSLSPTLERFSVLNLPELKTEIHLFFLQKKLPENLKDKLYQCLDDGDLALLEPLQPLPKFSKTDARREFAVRFKFQSGFDPHSFRLKFMATEYSVSTVLLLEFDKVGMREGFYSAPKSSVE